MIFGANQAMLRCCDVNAEDDRLCALCVSMARIQNLARTEDFCLDYLWFSYDNKFKACLSLSLSLSLSIYIYIYNSVCVCICIYIYIYIYIYMVQVSAQVRNLAQIEIFRKTSIHLSVALSNISLT